MCECHHSGLCWRGGRHTMQCTPCAGRLHCDAGRRLCSCTYGALHAAVASAPVGCSCHNTVLPLALMERARVCGEPRCARWKSIAWCCAHTRRLPMRMFTSIGAESPAHGTADKCLTACVSNCCEHFAAECVSFCLPAYCCNHAAQIGSACSPSRGDQEQQGLGFCVFGFGFWIWRWFWFSIT